MVYEMCSEKAKSKVEKSSRYISLKSNSAQNI